MESIDFNEPTICPNCGEKQFGVAFENDRGNMTVPGLKCKKCGYEPGKDNLKVS